MTAPPVLEHPAARDGVHFGPVELDLLATHAGTRFPFPLRVREFGRIPGEREVLLAAAGATLRARGLAGERGPLGVAAEVVTALREYRGSVDLVLVGKDDAAGVVAEAVVAMVYRSWALLCRQSMTGDPAANGVRIRRIAQNALAGELAGMVPSVRSAVTMPITLPPDGGDPGALDEFGRLVPELSGTGRLGATRRGPAGVHRAEAELSWLDGPAGRVRVVRAEDGWTSVNPLRHNELRATIDSLSMIARREDDGS